jgi:hypothetical protein
MLSVAGCALGVATKRNYQEPQADYRACLEANLANVQPCEDKRLSSWKRTSTPMSLSAKGSHVFKR